MGLSVYSSLSKPQLAATGGSEEAKSDSTAAINTSCEETGAGRVTANHAAEDDLIDSLDDGRELASTFNRTAVSTSSEDGGARHGPVELCWVDEPIDYSLIDSDDSEDDAEEEHSGNDGNDSSSAYDEPDRHNDSSDHNPSSNASNTSASGPASGVTPPPIRPPAIQHTCPIDPATGNRQPTPRCPACYYERLPPDVQQLMRTGSFSDPPTWTWLRYDGETDTWVL